MIVPPLPAAVNPGGAEYGGFPGGGWGQKPEGKQGTAAIAVIYAVTAPPTPPVYRSLAVHALLKPPAHSAYLSINAICRNTKIDLDTPAAAPAESSTRTTNEKVPTVVGLPVALPPEDNANPGGRAPDEIDHL